MKISRNKKEVNLLLMGISISIISQLSIFIGNSIVKILIMLIWLTLLGYILLKYNKKIKLGLNSIIVSIFIFDFFILLLSLLTEKKYFNSPLMYPINLSMFIFIISYFIGQLLDENIIKKISTVYISSSMILALYLYFDIFKGTDWINSSIYIYAAKNSAAQIILIAIIFLLFIEKNMNIIIKLSSICFFSLILLMLKSRATLIGLIIVFAYFLCFKYKSFYKKSITIIFGLMILIIILSNNELYELLINKILLNNRAGTNLNTITSGRIDHFIYFKENFENVFLFGTGGTYLESFPLASLMSYGILGSIPLFIICIYPFNICINYRKYNCFKDLNTTLILVYLTIIVNAIFEEQAPFGPGVKCFMLWLLTGLYVGLVYKKKINENNN